MSDRPSWLTGTSPSLERRPQPLAAFPSKGQQLDGSGQMMWNAGKVLGIGAVVGYPLYKVLADKASLIDGKAVIGWAFVGLVLILVSDYYGGCNPGPRPQDGVAWTSKAQLRGTDTTLGNPTGYAVTA